MIDVNTNLVAQPVNWDLVQSSRPDALVRPERGPITPHLDTAVRRQLIQSLRRVAEFIQPDGTIATVPLPASR